MDLMAIRSDEIRRVVKCVVCQRIAEIAANEIGGFREIVGAWLLSHLLPQKLLRWQADSVLLVDGDV